MRTKDTKTSIFLKEIEQVVRPGRQVGRDFQGEISYGQVNRIMQNPVSLPLETIIMRLKNVFQPERKLQEVIVPHFSTFLKLISVDEPIFYKGVSFNPLITTFGENVNLLDFYSWIKKARARGIVLDASLYAIVNAVKQSPTEIFSSRAAEEVVKFLKTGPEKYPEIEKAAKIREKYLRATAISLFPPKEAPLVISATELWDSKKYIECLQRAIEFCTKNPNEGQPIEIVRYANYTRYGTEYQRWYTVLILAEVLYLNQVYGVNIKLGPTSESNFDSVIHDFMKTLEIPFAFVWYNREVEKQIPYPDRLSFNDTKTKIQKKLSNSLLREWTMEIVEPFMEREDEDIITAIISIIQKINKTAKKELPRLNTEGTWFMIFPPGECD